MKRVATWSWAQDEAALFDASEQPLSQARRRQIINHLVQTLAGLAAGMEGENEVSQESISRLIAILRAMSESIASADDTTFNAIMREAALLVRAVRERQAYFSQFTVH
jgi:hypothetical protein